MEDSAKYAKDYLCDRIQETESIVSNNGNDTIDAHRQTLLSLLGSARVVLELLEVSDLKQAVDNAYRKLRDGGAGQPLPSVPHQRPPTDP